MLVAMLSETAMRAWMRNLPPPDEIPLIQQQLDRPDIQRTVDRLEYRPPQWRSPRFVTRWLTAEEQRQSKEFSDEIDMEVRAILAETTKPPLESRGSKSYPGLVTGSDP